MTDKYRRVCWAIEHVNTHQFIGLFNNYWTRGSISEAMLFDSSDAADAALQALWQEAKDRLAMHKESYPSQFWWDIGGGCTYVVELEHILQRSEVTTGAATR